MKLCVHKVCQTSSGADHVTIYEADIAFIAGDVQVEVASAAVGDTDPSAVEAAREAIGRGAEAVLRSRGLGAVILIERIVIHSVDFKPRRFEQHTAEALRRLLAQDARPGDGDDNSGR